MRYLKQTYEHVLLMGAIAEYSCTTELGSVEKEQALSKMINLSD
jgi:hypothetical protein